MPPVAIVTVIAAAIAVIAGLVLLVGLIRMSRPRASTIVDYPELPPPDDETAVRSPQAG